jgi:hypothetical protein
LVEIDGASQQHRDYPNFGVAAISASV